MKLVILAGTPGAGKTSIMLHVISYLKKHGEKCVVGKVDCLFTDDDHRYMRLGVPVIVGLSKDLCPDHYAVANMEEIFTWAKRESAQILIVETAGLCHRCAPYTKKSVGICVIDATCGPNTPRKVGPLLSTADIVGISKGDVISQAEREVFKDRVLESNPSALVFDVNGLNGQGATEIGEAILNSEDLKEIRGEELRYTMPLAICTYCAGDMKTGRENQRGVYMNLNGEISYEGE